MTRRLIDKDEAMDAIRALSPLHIRNTDFVPQVKRRPDAAIDRASALLALSHLREVPVRAQIEAIDHPCHEACIEPYHADCQCAAYVRQEALDAIEGSPVSPKEPEPDGVCHAPVAYCENDAGHPGSHWNPRVEPDPMMPPPDYPEWRSDQPPSKGSEE